MNVLFFGLGRVGLPQSLVFAAVGHDVYGYDADAAVIDDLISGRLPFQEPGMGELLSAHLGGRFHPIHDWQLVLPQIDAVLFTVGTKAPDAHSCLGETEGDLGPMEDILASLFGSGLAKAGLLLVFRTTLVLGSTERLKNYVERKFGLREGSDFVVSFVPERLAEGQAILEEHGLPKILSAFSPLGLDRVSALFRPVGGRQIVVSSPTAAEFCKLSDNSFRNTMFAFANELAMWSAQHGVDAHEIISAINTDYERTNVPQPGFVSGYCLGKDPYLFEYGFNASDKGREFQSLWYYGRRTNDELIRFAVGRVVQNLKASATALDAAKVVVLGLSFKEDIDDFRMSHAFDLIDALMAAGIRHITGFDPLIDANKYTRIPEKYAAPSLHWTSRLEPQLFAHADAVIVAHRHEVLRSQTFDSLRALLAQVHRPLYVFDGWNVWREAEKLDGVWYEGLGYIPKRATS